MKRVVLAALALALCATTQPALAKSSKTAQARANVAAVQAAQEAPPGLHILGNYLYGVGVKDCVRAGEAAAAAALRAPQAAARQNHA